uniref:RNase H type-1 domain-containing protein n=1 Tax=Chenopodium quinoa TaxID=63459 RepID=A0A803N314_CHEQI
MTNYPLKSVLRKPDLTRRLGKWSISLSTMDIEYQPRREIKSQALGDFVADFSPDLQVIADKEVEEINNIQKKGKWILDYLLIVSQMIGDFAAKDSKMTAYLNVAKEKAKYFNPFTISQIPRDQNAQADALANLASALNKTTFTNIPLVHLQKPSVSTKEILPVDDVNDDDDWTKPIVDYLTKDILPNDKEDSRKLKYKASRYHIVDGVLFHKSTSGLS